jgi:hypothetical protein
MITIISPAKSQDFSPIENDYKFTQPIFKDEIKSLINTLRHYEINEIEKLMKISPKLATEVFDKHSDFNYNKYSIDTSKPAIFTFSGDVYKGLDAESLDKKTIEYSQDHLLMLSGLYGVLRPLDLMQAYRLEMGTKIKVDDIVLYKNWQEKITAELNKMFTKHSTKVLINLASKEYSQSINIKQLKAIWLDVDFKEDKDGTFKTVGIHAKRARGLMTRYIMENQIDKPEDIKKFDVAGYSLNKKLSKDNYYCFTR